ncbi:MAG: 4Fe-4S binding protein [Chloroflexi bacterium]|nr:4Fe-4S binding protein [Chloroflexota bacterium]
MEGLKAELRKESRRVQLNFDELKSGGFIKQTQKDLFTVRLRCPGGRLTSDKLHKAAELAQKYGRGEVHISVRQSVEIPYVHYKDFEAVTKELAQSDWAVASCGPRIRVPTGCAGCTWNPNGLADTQAMCQEVDKRFFGTPTGHHKFKVSFSGCPIDCFRTREMDLGFQGMVEPRLVEELCNGCQLCVKACEESALHMEKDLPVRDLAKCNSCGDCIKVCPVDAMVVSRKGWLARVGGKHGKHPLFAYEVAGYLTEAQALNLIDKTMPWYREKGQGRERIGATIGRVGLDSYIDEVCRPLGLEVIVAPQERQKYWAGGNLYDGH